MNKLSVIIQKIMQPEIHVLIHALISAGPNGIDMGSFDSSSVELLIIRGHSFGVKFLKNGSLLTLSVDHVLLWYAQLNRTRILHAEKPYTSNGNGYLSVIQRWGLPIDSPLPPGHLWLNFTPHNAQVTLCLNNKNGGVNHD